MQDYFYEAKEQHQAELKTECTIKVAPDMIGKAIRIFWETVSLKEFADVESGISYEFLPLKKSDKFANMEIKSLFMYPEEETKRKMASLIKEISDKVKKGTANSLEPILRQ